MLRGVHAGPCRSPPPPPPPPASRLQNDKVLSQRTSSHPGQAWPAHHLWPCLKVSQVSRLQQPPSGRQCSKASLVTQAGVQNHNIKQKYRLKQKYKAVHHPSV